MHTRRTTYVCRGPSVPCAAASPFISAVGWNVSDWKRQHECLQGRPAEPPLTLRKKGSTSSQLQPSMPMAARRLSVRLCECGISTLLPAQHSRTVFSHAANHERPICARTATEELAPRKVDLALVGMLVWLRRVAPVPVSVVQAVRRVCECVSVPSFVHAHPSHPMAMVDMTIDSCLGNRRGGQRRSLPPRGSLPSALTVVPPRGGGRCGWGSTRPVWAPGRLRRQRRQPLRWLWPRCPAHLRAATGPAVPPPTTM